MLIILPLSVRVRWVVGKNNVLEFVRNSKDKVVVAVRAWKRTVPIDWEDFAETDFIPFACFNPTGIIGFHHDQDLPFGQKLYLNRSDIDEEVSDYHASSPTGSNNFTDLGFNTVEADPTFSFFQMKL